MHYSIPFIKDERQTKIFIYIACGLHAIISILLIAYFAEWQYLYSQASKYHFNVSMDPFIGFICFFGLESLLTYAFIILETFKPDLIPLGEQIKWWMIWWCTFLNAAFTTSSAIGGAVAIQYLKDFQNSISNMLAKVLAEYGVDVSDKIVYYKSWQSLFNLFMAIIILQFIISLPLFVIMIIGMINKIKGNRAVQTQKLGNKSMMTVENIDPSFSSNNK